MDRHNASQVIRFVAHSRLVLSMAKPYGWLPAARYTNLRDVRSVKRLGFLDVDWKNYNFERHLAAAKQTQPFMTTACDVEQGRHLRRILEQASELKRYCDHVVIVPKDPALADKIDRLIPREFILGFSVPTKYGGTLLPPEAFRRPVHLLGGRPDVQRKFADLMPVISVDCNRFTLDAAFGDYFDGETFRPHPIGGYRRCITDSIRNINALWESYSIKGQYNGRRGKRAYRHDTVRA